MMNNQDRHDQPERWIAEGLDHLGKGIALAGFWIGLGISFKYVIMWLSGKL
jgi:hypothetical protein